MYQCCNHVSMAVQKRTGSIVDYFSASTKGPAVEKRPRGDVEADVEAESKKLSGFLNNWTFQM